MDINVFTFDIGKTDKELLSAIAKISERSILLLEDIDCGFQSRDENKITISHSSLYNVLDGVVSSKGLVTIITTNHIEKLDPALLRPGRIDMMIKFNPLTPKQLRIILERYDYFFRPETIDKITQICTMNNVVPALVTSFLFRHRNKQTNDSNIIDLFREYMREFEPYTKKINNISNDAHSNIYM
jgi:chaperone BCS1